MTMPDSGSTDGLQGQILLKLGEVSTQVAVITKTLEAVPDHEYRIRALEQQASQSRGSRDVTARLVATGGVIAALASPIVVYLHH